MNCHEMIMYRNGLQDYRNSDECHIDKRSAIDKEIYYVNLWIEVMTVRAHQSFANIAGVPTEFGTPPESWKKETDSTEPYVDSTDKKLKFN